MNDWPNAANLLGDDPRYFMLLPGDVVCAKCNLVKPKTNVCECEEWK